MSEPYHIYNTSPVSGDHAHWIVEGPDSRKVRDCGDGARGKRKARAVARAMNEGFKAGQRDNRHSYAVGDMDLDPGVRFEIDANRVSLLIDGEVALEYNHPNPGAVLARIRVIRVLPGNAFGDNRREAIVHWGHGCGHVDGLHQRTTFTDRSLLPAEVPA